MYLNQGKCTEKLTHPPPHRKSLSSPSRESYHKITVGSSWRISYPGRNLKLVYAQNFAEDIGAPALPFRMALGSLIIKERLGISDRETVEQIKENPYLQYFIGRKNYSNEAPYDASLLVRFRERINVNLINQINQRMVNKIQEETEEEAKKKAHSQKDQKQENTRIKGN